MKKIIIIILLIAVIAAIVFYMKNKTAATDTTTDASGNQVSTPFTNTANKNLKVNSQSTKVPMTHPFTLKSGEIATQYDVSAVGQKTYYDASGKLLTITTSDKIGVANAV